MLLQMLIDSRKVLDTISIICAVHVATDHLKTALLKQTVLLNLVVFLHLLGDIVVPIDDGGVAGVLHFQLHEELTDVGADSRATLV